MFKNFCQNVYTFCDIGMNTIFVEVRHVLKLKIKSKNIVSIYVDIYFITNC